VPDLSLPFPLSWWSCSGGVFLVLIGDNYKERTFLPLENACDEFFCVYQDPYPDCNPLFCFLIFLFFPPNLALVFSSSSSLLSKARDPPIAVAVLESDRVIFHDPSFQGFSPSSFFFLCHDQPPESSFLSLVPHRCHFTRVFVTQGPSRFQTSCLVPMLC